MELKTFEELLAEVPVETVDKVNDDISFAILVRDWLEIKGWTQKELAQKLGMKESQLSRILSGHNNLTLATIRRFERVLGERLLMFAQSPLEQENAVSAFTVHPFVQAAHPQQYQSNYPPSYQQNTGAISQAA
jgi:transcriptional regulator with XRE-family HTH domain